jgi:hypothetical protein
MTVRVQVILDEKEADCFKAQAENEKMSLSAWLRDAGRMVLEIRCQQASLTELNELRDFFAQCAERESGRDPDWEEHKKCCCIDMLAVIDYT